MPVGGCAPPPSALACPNDAPAAPCSYGFAIITLTLLVKLATYPLTKKQVGGRAGGRCTARSGVWGQGGRVCTLQLSATAASICACVHDWQAAARACWHALHAHAQSNSELSSHGHGAPARAQVESTLSMQAMQPKVKALQAKYANDPERLQVGAGGAASQRMMSRGVVAD